MRAGKCLLDLETRRLNDMYKICYFVVGWFCQHTAQMEGQVMQGQVMISGRE